MQKITPMLWFDKNAEEALNFYSSVFKDSSVGKVSRYPPGAPGEVGSVMTGELTLFGQKFLLLNAGPMFKFNESISFVVGCDTQEEVDYYWDKLTADGGEESMCGWLKDRFGLSWQITPNMMSEIMSNPATAPAAMKAMMTMKKLDIAKLKEAAGL
jgi:predicted 3-demethylubiquinone-9 3-methyltransferase (glyoxalase superfamily)